MSRKISVVVSFVLALIFTLLIVVSANKKYNEAVKTVEVAQVTKYISVGDELGRSNIKSVKAQKSAAKNLASYEEAVGKTAKVSMIKGQYVYKNALASGKEARKGFVEVFVPVDLSSSAYAFPGQKVSVYIINKDTGESSLVLKGARVLHALTSQGDSIGDTGGGKMAEMKSSQPASIGLEVPPEHAGKIVKAAAEKKVYLVRET
ncbi:MAG: SAF domain protein [Clostridia bacterium 41_269]|nr:MAG: SAF domain protein [Clostridia bacterium 41_269]